MTFTREEWDAMAAAYAAGDGPCQLREFLVLQLAGRMPWLADRIGHLSPEELDALHRELRTRRAPAGGRGT